MCRRSNRGSNSEVPNEPFRMTQLDKNRTRQESVRGLRAPKSTAQDLIGSANEIFEKMKDPPTRRPRKVWNGYCQGSSSDF